MQPLRALPVAAVLLLAGCASGGGAAATTDDPTRAAAAGTSTASLIATLAGRGTVTLTPGARANQTRATVSIRNAPPNAELGWRIIQGQCGERGPELGPQAAYRTIMTRGDGSGEVTATLPFPMPSNNSYHVNVYSSRQNEVIIGCGGLSETGGD
jgi:hypothetical protein